MYLFESKTTLSSNLLSYRQKAMEIFKIPKLGELYVPSYTIDEK